MDKFGRRRADGGPVSIVIAVALGIVFITFFTAGGLSTLWDIFRFMKNIPTPVWVFLGILFIFNYLGDNK